MLSVVAHRDHSELLLVRARTKEHLRNFLEHADDPNLLESIVTMPSADYEYRIELNRETFGKLLLEQADEIDYPNFKDECDRRPDKAYARSLREIWSVLFRLLAKNR